MENSLVSNYTEKANFWKLYPAFKIPKIYKDFYTNDKSKAKKNSSDLMWAFTFIFDKSIDNPYKMLQSSDRFEVVSEDILGVEGEFNWEPYKDLLEFTKKVFMTEIERTYYALVEVMEVRRKFLEDTPYTLDTAKTLDSVIKETQNVRKELDELKKTVENQESNGKTKGNIIESFGERQLI